jgi:pimeloyl-ACP methyl ester carboxylesterase
MNTPMAPVRTSHVWRAPAGLWAYDCWGRHGRPVVLLPAVLFDRVMWWPASADLRLHATVIAVDLPGHGGSTRRRRYDADEIVDDLAQLLHHLDLRQAPVVVGHGCSAYLAERFAARYATHAVVTVDPPPNTPVDHPGPVDVEAYLAGMHLDAVSHRYRDLVTPAHDQALLDAYNGGAPRDLRPASRTAVVPARLAVHSQPPAPPSSTGPGGCREEVYHVSGRFAHLADPRRFMQDVRALL